MYSIIVLIKVLLVLLLWLIFQLVVPPFSFPRNIPTIPFYVSFLGIYTNLDQQDIYNKYLREKLEKYGAVKVYFASRWNIVVSKPDYLNQIFKDDKVFTKSGNNIKIPYAVISDYTGENLISAHGETWKLFRKVLTRSIQFPNLEPITHNSQKFINLINKQLEITNALYIGDSIQRLCLDNIIQSMLGLNISTLTNENSMINLRLNYVKRHIFKPFFLNFPFFDTFYIPSRIKARNEVHKFRNYFSNLIKNNQESTSQLSASKDLIDALNTGTLNEKQFTDNAMIIMIAGHENPQLLLNSILYVLAKHPHIQQSLRRQLYEYKEDIHNCPLLNAIIYETLRMYPPLGQIINRCTSKNVILGGNIKIPRGTYVGYNNFATGRDRNVWGNADTFSPERWGTSNEEITKSYTYAKIEARLPSFHGRKRACLGEKFALHETRNVITELIKTYKINLDLEWEDKLTPSGPVAPLKLKLILRKLD